MNKCLRKASPAFSKLIIIKDVTGDKNRMNLKIAFSQISLSSRL
jgi:hypothetical protein